MEEKLAENTFQALHTFLVDNNLVWVYLVIAALTLIGGAIGWLLAAGKTKSEIEKLKSEVKKLESEAKKNNLESQEKIVSIFEKLNSYAEKYKAKSKEFQELLINFIEKKESEDKDGGKEAWKKLNSVFLSGVVDSFLTYFRIYREIYQDDDEKRKEFASLELVPFLETCADCLNEFNSDEVLNFVDNDSFHVRKSLFEPMIEFALDTIPNNSKANLLESKNLLLQNSV